MLAANTTSVADHRQFDSFGKITSETIRVNFLYSYTGQIYDADIEAYLYDRRWYDPITHRFLSEDPQAARSFDTNPSFCYVGNNPTNSTDPSGLIEYTCGKEYANGRVSSDGKSFILNEPIKDAKGYERKKIPIEKGHPNFDKWSVGDVKVAITGDDKFDQAEAKRAYKKKYGKNIPDGYTFHHDGRDVKTVTKNGKTYTVAKMQVYQAS